MIFKIVLLITIYALIVFLEMRPLVRKRQIKEIWTVSLLFLIGFVLSLLVVLKIQLPIPNIRL